MALAKNITKLFILLVAAALLLAFSYAWNKFPALKPSFLPPAERDNDAQNLGFKVADGFSVSVFAENLPGARVMAMDPYGNFWVSQTSEGKISLLEVEEGKVKNILPVLHNLSKPHGLVFDPTFNFMLYFAEENKISRIATYSDGPPEKIVDLPISGGGHFTRTIAFGPDDRLYVSIGSSCNVCVESDDRRAKIFSMKRDGSDFKEFARGLRNTVFFTWHPVDGKMWGTDMGRDWLGDNNPPDEINIIEEGKNYGWPICYGKNIHDTDFDHNTYIRAPCTLPFETPSHIDIPAHSAPLGIAIIPEEGWPEDFWFNAVVALHGSWNRSEPAGYKVVRYKLDPNGNYISGPEDFITGFLNEKGEAVGRPVQILAMPGGQMYITDDKAGVIYKVTRNAADL